MGLHRTRHPSDFGEHKVKDAIYISRATILAKGKNFSIPPQFPAALAG